MRVSDTNSNPIQSSETKRAGKSEAAKDGKKADRSGNAAAGAADAVKSDLSARGKEMSRATAVARATPDVREEKIAELKKRIAEGSYKVDTKAVADRMVDEHLAAEGG